MNISQSVSFGEVVNVGKMVNERVSVIVGEVVNGRMKIGECR